MTVVETPGQQAGDAASLLGLSPDLADAALAKIVDAADAGDRRALNRRHRLAIGLERESARLRVIRAGRPGVPTATAERRRVLRERAATCARLLRRLATGDCYRQARAMATTSAADRDGLAASTTALAARVLEMLDREAQALVWHRLVDSPERDRPPAFGGGVPRVQPRAPRAPALPVWAGLCW